MKHFKHTLATYTFSATSTCCLDEWRLVDAELNAGAKIVVAELIGDPYLVVAELASKTELDGGGARGPQRRRVEVTGVELAGGVELTGSAELGGDA
jgi:hypothetical protein